MSEPSLPAKGNVAALAWDRDKQILLDRLNERLELANPENVQLVARRFLELLRAFSEIPTPEQVARAVFAHDWPQGGAWLGWDWDRWRGYTGQVISALQSSDPAAALYL